jgi:hypothetical protein
VKSWLSCRERLRSRPRPRGVACRRSHLIDRSVASSHPWMCRTSICAFLRAEDAGAYTSTRAQAQTLEGNIGDALSARDWQLRHRLGAQRHRAAARNDGENPCRKPSPPRERTHVIGATMKIRS